eukprot:4447231-Amphidinium_carterae.1
MTKRLMLRSSYASCYGMVDEVLACFDQCLARCAVLFQSQTYANTKLLEKSWVLTSYGLLCVSQAPALEQAQVSAYPQSQHQHLWTRTASLRARHPQAATAQLRIAFNVAASQASKIVHPV